MEILKMSFDPIEVALSAPEPQIFLNAVALVDSARTADKMRPTWYNKSNSPREKGVVPMKKRAFVGGLVAMALFLTACNLSTHSSSESSASKDTTSSGVSVASEISSSSCESSEPSGCSDSSDSPLHFYSSLEDFPYAKLGYSDHRSILTRDGKGWLAAPGTFMFGDRLFSDGKIFFIQVYWPNSSGKPEGDFSWLSCCFNDLSRYVPAPPPETYNKLFVRAEGHTVYTEDGESYTLPDIECPTVPEVSPLRFYSSLEDFPYAKLGYDNNRNGLTKDGEDWLVAPDMDIFGDHLFSDGKVLYIQVYWANSSGKSDGDFYWLSCCLSDPSRNLSILPPETYNKLFVRAKGYTAYTEDGESYSFSCGECE